MKYPWKQCTRPGRSPFRDWTREHQNSVRRFACPCGGCVKDARRFVALMRLVERKAGAR